MLVQKRRARYRYPRLFLTMYVFFLRVSWSQKRRVRYRYSPRFLKMHAILGIPLPSLRKRRCERRISPCPRSFRNLIAFFCFLQLFCFVYHRQSQFWGFRCLRLANDVASAKSHRVPGPFSSLMVLKYSQLCFA